MKNQKKLSVRKATLLVAFVVFCFVGSIINAQITCNYPVTNNTPCGMTVRYEMLDASYTAVCGPMNAFISGSGTTYLTCCPNAYDISIEIIECPPGCSTSVSSIIDNFCSPLPNSASYSYDPCGACPAGTAIGNIAVTPAGCTIN